MTVLAAILSAAVFGFGYAAHADLLYNAHNVWAKRDSEFWVSLFIIPSSVSFPSQEQEGAALERRHNKANNTT